MIPKILHFIWIQGASAMPAEYRWCLDTWAPMYPGWEIKLWTRDNLPKLQNSGVWKRNVPTVQSDIARLEVVWRMGGVFMDVDMQCLRPIGPLIKDSHAFVSMRNRDFLENSGFGAEPEHPWLLDAIREFDRSQEKIWRVLDADAPFRKAVDLHPEIDVFPYTVFHVIPNDSRKLLDEAYTIHHRFSDWMRDDPRFAPYLVPACEQGSGNPMVEA